MSPSERMGSWVSDEIDHCSRCRIGDPAAHDVEAVSIDQHRERCEVPALHSAARVIVGEANCGPLRAEINAHPARRWSGSRARREVGDLA